MAAAATTSARGSVSSSPAVSRPVSSGHLSDLGTLTHTHTSERRPTGDVPAPAAFAPPAPHIPGAEAMPDRPAQGGPPVTLTLYVHYATHFGQQIGIIGTLAGAHVHGHTEARVNTRALPPTHVSTDAMLGDARTCTLLQYEDAGRWRITLNVPREGVRAYKYVLVAESGEVEEEWGPARIFNASSVPPTSAHVERRDAWRPASWPAQLFKPMVAAAAFGRSTAGPTVRTGIAEIPRDVAEAAANATVDDAEPEALIRGTFPVTAVAVSLRLCEARVPAGAQLMVSGSCAALGRWNVQAAAAMHSETFPVWRREFVVHHQEFPVEYKFLLRRDASTPPAWEEGPNRKLLAPEYARAWQLSDEEMLALPDPTIAWHRMALVLRPAASMVREVTRRRRALRADKSYGHSDDVVASAEGSPPPSATASAAASTDEPDIESVAVTLRPSASRDELARAASGTAPCIVQEDFIARGNAWNWRVAGLSIPVFSLRSRGDSGVGEFADIPALVDWARRSGLKCIHMLPVHDTSAAMTPDDSCPYNAISAFALHPIYINLQAAVDRIDQELGGLRSPGASPPRAGGEAVLSLPADLVARPPPGSSPPATGRQISDLLKQRIQAAQQQLSGAAFTATSWAPAGPSRTPSGTLDGRQHHPPAGMGWDSAHGAPLDYESVVSLKLSLLRELYRAVGGAVLASRAFAQWFRDNRTWLQPYALFCFMRELHGVGRPARWGDRNSITLSGVHALTDASHFHYPAVAFWYFVQFELHCQLLQAATHARAQGVMLLLDMSPSVPHASVDVWARSGLFLPSTSLGAPPDAFAVDGQQWHHAPLDWQHHEAAVHAWWAERLAHSSQYFTGVRIRNVETFFRSFLVDEGAVSGLGGVFQPAQGFTADDLSAAGLSDLQRATTPYIREWTLRAAFGPQFASVASRFLRAQPGGFYAFRPEFDTEMKIYVAGGVCLGIIDIPTNHLFALQAALQRTSDENLIMPLVRLVNNRCLVPVEPAAGGAIEFHPSVTMPSSTAYLEAAEEERSILDGVFSTYFGEKQQQLWRLTGLRRLHRLVTHAPLLIIADDTGCSGDFSAIVRFVGILGTRTHRIAPGAELSGHASGQARGRFAAPSAFEPQSVAMTSTADLSPIRSWWEEDYALTAAFVRHALRGSVPTAEGSTIPATCTTEAAKEILVAYLNSPACVVLLPWQDAVAMDARLRVADPHAERINVPSNPSHYWRWRMHLSLEALLSDAGAGFIASMRGLLTVAGRAL